ncbi:MAG: FAD:protein FMN transferase [Hyphomicrobiales bacterium]|nr:FAD:protein FMN transferase [Hyphomicrobiales bacterium]
MTLNRRMLLITGLVHCMTPVSRAEAESAQVITGAAFGSTWWAVLPHHAESERARAVIRSVVQLIDTTMSPFRSGSEIGRFNETDSVDWISMSPHTVMVASEALGIARRMKGAFDPTVGGLVGRYGFGPIKKCTKENYLGVSVTSTALRKSASDLTLDLCGIAKGYAADLIAAELSARGLTDFFIEIGGEVRGKGLHPGGRKWLVGIERPLPGDRSLHCVVGIGNLALATSGDLVNSYVAGGRRYGHIIDPSHGLPADTGLASVSVLARSAMEADAMATGLFALGSEAGPDCASALELDTLFLVRDGGGFREVMTGNFATYITH